MDSSRQEYRQYRTHRSMLGRQRTKGNGRRAEHAPLEKSRTLTYYLRRYFKSAWSFKGHIIFLACFSLCALAFNAISPWTGKFMLDWVFVPRPEEATSPGLLPQALAQLTQRQLLLAACAALALVALCEIVFKTASDYTAKLLAAKMEARIRRQLIQHLQLMSLDTLEKLKTGGIISRLEGDVTNFSTLLYQGALAPLQGLLMFAIGLGSLAFVSGPITMLCLVCVCLVACSAYLIFNVMRPLFRDLHEDMARISARLGETFAGIRVVRIFGREADETRQFITAHNLLIRKTMHTEKLNIATRRSIDAASWTMEIAVWLVGGLAVINRSITVGDLIVFTRFTKWFFYPVFMVMHNLSLVQNSIACTERIYDLLDEPQDVEDRPGALDPHTLRRGFQISHLNFAYTPEKKVLKDLCLTIPAGKTTAIVGPSGVGKTALTNLLVRFYEPNSGSLEMDGIPIRDFKLKPYRNLFALVLQEVMLFDGTVRQNIAFSKPQATLDEITAAARAANAHDFIQELPQQYDTPIGERGIKLSGGQRQRISLARAILKNPQILILDEATSALDTRSEQIIQDALRSILRNRTTIVIAHRLSTVVDADQIAVMVDGTIAERGTHPQLMARKGVYADMYARQLQDDGTQTEDDGENHRKDSTKKGTSYENEAT